LLTVAYI